MAKDLFAPLSKEERSAAESDMFAPLSKDELQSAGMPSAGPSIPESVLAGAQQGLTLGHADELGAAMGAGLEKGAAMTGLGPQTDQSLKDLYNEYLQANRKRLGAAEAANRVTGKIPFTNQNVSVGASDLGALAGGFLIPGLGGLGPEASMGEKMVHGAKQGALVGGIAGEGQSDAPLVSSKTLGNTLGGAAIGTGLGIAAPPVFDAAAATGKAVGNFVKGGVEKTGALLENLLSGQAGTAFKRGFGLSRGEREFNVGSQAQLEHSNNGLEIGGEFASEPQSVLQSLGKEKNEIIEAAAKNGSQIDPEQVDSLINKQLQNNPLTTLDKVKSEMQKLRNMLLEARDGEEVEKIKRVYFAEGNSEKEKFLQKVNQKQVGESMSEAPDYVPKSPRDEFEAKAKVNEAKRQALAGQESPIPHEISYEPIDGDPNNELALVKQKQFDDDGHFKGYKEIDSEVLPKNATQEQMQDEVHFIPADAPGKLIAVRRRPILDENGEISGYKVLDQKTVNAEDAAKYKDITETVREKKFDLRNPEHLYNLYKDLKTKSAYPKNPWEAENSFSTPEAQGAAQSTMKDINATLRNNIPELQPVDQQIQQYNQATSVLEQKPYNIDMGADPQENSLKLIKLIEKSSGDSPEAVRAKEALTDYLNKLKIANPEMGHRLESKMQDWLERNKVLGAANESIYLPRPAARPQALASKAGAVSGYALGSITPDWMRNVATQLSRSGSKATSGVGQLLNNLADKDERTRNAVMWSVMQNPAYREMLKPHLPEGKEQ